MSPADFPFAFPLAAAGIFLLGLVFGSFLNVCIYRLPRRLSVVHPRSACPNCNSPIRAYDNVPVVSWLFLKRRCRDCHAGISARYPAIELLTALLFAGCFLRFGFTPATIKYCVFSFLLTALIFTDIDHKLLPDALTLPGIWLGLGFSWLVPVDNLASGWLPRSLWLGISPDISWRLQSLLDSATGAAVGASFIYGVGFLYLQLRKIEGMGFGDVKLMAMVGAFLGTRLTIFTIFTAALAGSAFGIATILIVWQKRLQRRLHRGREPLAIARRRAWHSASLLYRRYELPFGAFLGTMALLAAFSGNAIIRWYAGQYGIGYL